MPASAAPTVTTQPVTSDRVAVLLAKAPDGTARLLDESGSVLATAPVAAGNALLTVPATPGRRTELALEVGGNAVSVSTVAIDATAAGLEQSTWRVVNKRTPLPSTYAPTRLVAAGSGTARPEVAAAYGALTAAAKKAGLDPFVVSGYRSYAYQVATHQHWESVEGAAGSDSSSARPGHSEHQLGLALDLMGRDGQCELRPCFAGTPFGKWLAANAHQFGFILRYENGRTPVTGYVYEPWHYRYLGVPMAMDYHRSGAHTFEEYLGLPAAPGY